RPGRRPSPWNVRSPAQANRRGGTARARCRAGAAAPVEGEAALSGPARRVAGMTTTAGLDTTEPGTTPATEPTTPTDADTGTVAGRDVAPRAPGLSPSRAADFLRCPLLFRFRVVDRLPEPPSSAAARGTLVHAVLERLYDAPAGERTKAAALDLLPAEWERLVEVEPRYATLFEPGGDAAGTDVPSWLDGAGRLLGTYFRLEDPNRLEPQARELKVSTQLDGGPLLRGI